MAPLPAQHLAFRILERTSHRNLERRSEPLPVVRDNDVLIQVHGVTLNSRDIQITGGWYPALGLKSDLVPCSDGAGVVVAVGSSVQNFSVGDRVLATFALNNIYGPLKDQTQTLGGGVDGMLRQYAAVPEHAVVKIPQECKLDFVQLASLVCTGATVWNALYGSVPMRPGQTVLFQGTGGVSITGIQLAKAAGAITIVTSSSDDKLQFVKETFGVDHVINYRTTPDWADEVLRLTHGVGADYVIEIGGAGTIEQSIKAVTRGGVVSVVGYLADIKPEAMPNVALLALIKGCCVRGILIGSHQLTTELVRFVTQKNIQPYIHKTFGFSREEVIAAFDHLESGNHIGKWPSIIAIPSSVCEQIANDKMSDVAPLAIPEELETLPGFESSDQVTLDAAMEFVDACESQEQWDSTQTTESSSSSVTSSPPSAEETADKEPKSKKKPRVRKPDRTRQELLYLRETVGELEKKLSELVDEQRKHKEQLAVNSSWAKAASEQRIEREQSEEQNARLRTMYVEQIQLVKNLDRMLQKRGYVELLGSDVVGPNVKRVRGQPDWGFRAQQLEADLNRTVREMYEQVDAISSDPQLELPENTPSKRVVELLSDDVSGAKVQSLDSRILPFSYVETANAAWEFVADRVHFDATCQSQRNEETKLTKISTGRIGWLGSTDEFRVMIVAHRHILPNRVVIVSCMLLEPTQLGCTRLNGVWMRMRAWHIIQPGPSDSPDRPTTLKQTISVATPEVHELDETDCAGGESGMGALTDFVLRAADGQMELSNQRVENRLADELLRLQIEDPDSGIL
ncbi:hypothetical protein Poli38472_004886 [Pythium oligandrum]|uniref:Enoyl reductase (ER) domain-containing protein n=1 Tax=Pythium oligandrum TaxID=41045 RepID=A0A8K1CCH7_PYTOL|nr:hypothetical protein Poli38472_004886 [Pythium oligandrum]|eukprot:TMW59817.1 hypothetical protein Poli38472_004886 [Pythium oligandrum]